MDIEVGRYFASAQVPYMCFGIIEKRLEESVKSEEINFISRQCFLEQALLAQVLLYPKYHLEAFTFAFFCSRSSG